MLDDAATLRAAREDPAGFVRHPGSWSSTRCSSRRSCSARSRSWWTRTRGPGGSCSPGRPRSSRCATCPTRCRAGWRSSSSGRSPRARSTARPTGSWTPPSGTARPSSTRRPCASATTWSGPSGAGTPRRRALAAPPAAFFESYLTTLIERDVRQLAQIERRGELRRLFALLAGRSGGLLVPHGLAAQAGLPDTTVRRYVELLAAVFLVKQVPAWTPGPTGRAVGTPKLAFVDTGVAAYLLGQDVARLGEPDGAAGPLLETFVVAELARQLTWNEQQARLYHYRTRDRVEVDAVLEAADGRVVAVEVKAGATVRTEDLAGLRHLRNRLGDRFVAGIVLLHRAADAAVRRPPARPPDGGPLAARALTRRPSPAGLSVPAGRTLARPDRGAPGSSSRTVASRRDTKADVTDRRRPPPRSTTSRPSSALPRLGGLALSPDGSRLVAARRRRSTREGTWYVTALWEVDPAGERPARRLTRSAQGRAAPAFRPDGDAAVHLRAAGPDAGDGRRRAGAGAVELPGRRAARRAWSLARPGGVARSAVARGHRRRRRRRRPRCRPSRRRRTTRSGARQRKDAQGLGDPARAATRCGTGTTTSGPTAPPVRRAARRAGAVASTARPPARHRAAGEAEPHLALRDLTGHVGGALGAESSWDVRPTARPSSPPGTAARRRGSQRSCWSRSTSPTGERRTAGRRPAPSSSDPASRRTARGSPASARRCATPQRPAVTNAGWSCRSPAGGVGADRAGLDRWPQRAAVHARRRGVSSSWPTTTAARRCSGSTWRPASVSG